LEDERADQQHVMKHQAAVELREYAGKNFGRFRTGLKYWEKMTNTSMATMPCPEGRKTWQIFPATSAHTRDSP